MNLVRMNSNIGSSKMKGKSAGHIDSKTLEKIEESKLEDSKKPEKKEKKPEKTLNLAPEIVKLISHIYVL